MNTHNGIRLALKFVLVQLAICSAIVLVTWLIFDQKMARAALAGSMINVIASAYFALVSLKLPKNATPGIILARFYIGEMGKFVVVAVGFVGVFRYFPDISQGRHAIVLFVAFLLTQLAFIVAPLLLKKDF